MKKIFLIGILYSFIFNVFGQDFNYDWEKDRSLYKLSSAEKDIPLYVLDQKNIYNYFLEDNGLKVSYTFHKIVRVTNDDALQKSTRIVVPLGDDGELKQLKARTIEPSGKEILFDETELKELEDEQSGSGYKIFAIEGAIKGSEIEFFYTVEKGADLFLRQFMQFDFPVKTSEFHLSCPEHLKFDVKAYNNLAEAKIEEGKEERNEYTIKQNDISALLEEQFSSYDNSRMRVEAKLSYNTARNNSRMFTWSDAAKRIYENLYTLDKSELKTVSSLVKKIKIADSDNEITRILKIEDYLKRTIYFENRAPSELLVQTVRNRYANKPTMT
ncbi:MAG: DUF3857 domain-containing protein, partial [Cyclobacteriaceae bacterium]|nr:DUF3857 domain-containing protein [Cyclobacteriaceae bacterium]